jgi:hypothetical protein
MKEITLILAFFVTILIPGISLSQHEVTADVEDLDRSEILEIKDVLRNKTEDLSLLKKELLTVYTSMTAHQGKERYLVMRSRENIANIEGIYRYVEGALAELFLVDPNRISYYHYLKEYGIGKMRKLVNEYLENIQEVCPEISNRVASHVIDQATETICLSSGLLDRGIDIVQQYSRQRKPQLRHH